ncbi:MAG: T9SS type A sorting domain-containing protein [Bacteroidetes bacterium]|nr:T9SS type A sorting domain-containing protein [Bacteroidota bacterium]
MVYTINRCLLLFVFLMITCVVNAQNVVWSNGYSNSSSNLSVKNLRSNSSGENYTVGSFGRKIDFDAGAGSDTLDAAINTGDNASVAGFISKTDNSGNHLWARALYPINPGAMAVINDVDMDANANVYVAGNFHYTLDFDPGPAVDSLNSSGAYGAFIMKLNPSGNLLWVHTYLGMETKIWDIKIDENDGLIIVGSFTDTLDFDPSPAVYNLISDNSNDLFVIKMNASGNFLWAKTWVGSDPNLGPNIGRACLDADIENNIYVTGSISLNQVDLDPGLGVMVDTGKCFVAKLDPSGNFIWGQCRSETQAMVLATNSTDLYLYGYKSNEYVYLAEYDSSGTQLWNKHLEDPVISGANFNGEPSALTQDLAGNLVMGGRQVNRYFLYTTDSSGNMQWLKKSKTTADYDHLTVRMSPLDDIMVAGDFRNVFDVDFGPGVDTLGAVNKYSSFLMKYSYCGSNTMFNFTSCDSVVLPDTTYNVSVNFANEYLDINGCDSNVFNHISIGILSDVSIAGCDSAVYNGQAYYQSGIYNQIVTPNVPGCDSILDIHVYINTDTNLNPFMQLIQEVPDSLIANNAGSVFVEVDSLYNMYIGGIYAIHIPQLNMNPDVGLVARVDSSGNLVWKHAVKDEWTNKSVSTRSIALDDNLNLYASTIYTNYGVADANSKGIVEITNFNNIADDTSGFGPFPPTDKYLCILNDPSSNKMVKLGSVPTAYPNNPSAVIVKRGNSSITFGAVANAWGTGSCYGETGAIDSQGNIYICGKWQEAPLGGGPGQSGLHACFIAKLDSNLNLLWNKLIDPATSYSKLTISNMKFDNNSLLVSGNFNRKLDLDYTPNTYFVYPEDGSAILARFDTAANIIWATPYGTLGNVTPYGLTVDDGGQIYVSGRISNNVDLQPGPGISYFKQYCQNSSLGYISKFTSTGTFIRVMGMHDYMTSIKFKSPNRIYAAGGIWGTLVSVYELTNDTTVYTYPEICAGDSINVGNSVYSQSGIYTNVFLSYLNTDSIVITNLTVNPLPAVIANASDTLLCMGDSVVLSGSGAFTYSWNNGAIDNQLFSPAGSNTYIVTGTDTNGCVNSDSINVVVNSLPTVAANATDTVLCFGDSLILYGSGALSYTWNNLVIDSVLFAPSASGYYVVNGTDTNGCINQDSVEIIVHALPTVLANASDTSLCMGDSVILFGSGALTYTWNNAVIDSMIFSPNMTNNYVVTATDVYGCVNTDSITVVVNTLPIVTANASDTLICYGDSMLLFGAGALTYTWNNLVIDSVLFAPLATGYYVVNGTDTNGCMNQDSIEIIVNALPPVMANASDTSLCIGDSVMLFGSGALTYVWNNLVIDSMIFAPNITSNYVVTGTDTNGCVNTDSITVVVNPLPNVVANASDTSVCVGNPVTLFGTGADSFSWTNAVIDSVAFYPLDTAMYVVTGLDINGCMGQDSILIQANQIPFPILVFSGDTLYCTNVTGVNIYWYKDTVAIDSLTNYYVVTQNGNYEVFVVDSNGCAGADSISMLNMSYQTTIKSELIQVYPNPTQGALNIAFDMKQPGDVELMISDLLGKKVYSSKNTIRASGNQQLQIDLSPYHLTKGIYFLNLIMDGRRSVVKFEYQK